MKKLTLKIDEEKYGAFLTFIETLDYVSISSQDEIPEWQKLELDKRLAQIEKGQV